jgi:hypothetical protein
LHKAAPARTCVILTLAGKKVRNLRHDRGAGRTVLLRRGARPASDFGAKGSDPALVWFAVALLSIRAATYVTSVDLLEYMMTFF